MAYRINNEDVNKWSKEYTGEKFHALLCDAPYHLTTITKRFGKEGAAPAKFGTDGLFQRTSKGFMGQEWDGGDVAFRPETWAGLGEHLYPGAFGMTFGGARTAHKIAMAIEEAGFIIHPMIGWINGQGFPKATRIDNKVDREAGAQRNILGVAKGAGSQQTESLGKYNPEYAITSPVTSLAQSWEGHRYSMQALKPALEPIIVFQKPYEGRPLDNIVSTGAGTINIDGGRIQLKDEAGYTINRFTDGARPFGDAVGEEYDSVEETKGRWPANFIIDKRVAESLDRQSGHLKSGKMLSTQKRSTDRSPNGIYGKFNIDAPIEETIGDSGGASRFFFNVETKLDEADPFIYEKKVSQVERNAGLEELPTVMMGMSGGAQSHLEEGYDNGQGIGLNRVQSRKNTHPTLKSISLTKYLATLLLPPIEYAPRRLLIPFSGVSSEMIGGLLAGWEYVEGIEMTEEYIPIAHKRLEYWCKE